MLGHYDFSAWQNIFNYVEFLQNTVYINCTDKLTEVISKQSPLIIQMMQSNEISVCVATLQEMLEKGMHSNVTIWVSCCPVLILN